jgi:hypothetical protein
VHAFGSVFRRYRSAHAVGTPIALQIDHYATAATHAHSLIAGSTIPWVRKCSGSVQEVPGKCSETSSCLHGLTSSSMSYCLRVVLLTMLGFRMHCFLARSDGLHHR